MDGRKGDLSQAAKKVRSQKKEESAGGVVFSVPVENRKGEGKLDHKCII